MDMYSFEQISVYLFLKCARKSSYNGKILKFNKKVKMEFDSFGMNYIKQIEDEAISIFYCLM